MILVNKRIRNSCPYNFFLSFTISMKASMRVAIWLSEKNRSSTMSASIIKEGRPRSSRTIR